MTATPVGMRCPECAKQRTKVHTMGSVGGASGAGARVTLAIIAVCVVVFLLEGNFGVTTGGGGSSWIYQHGALWGPALYFEHEYWRMISSGFLHTGLLHIAFNMYILYMLGKEIEQEIGSPRFGLLYFTALLGGAFGALLQTTTTPTVGASGAVFGLMGFLVVEMLRRGINPLQSPLGMLLILNVVISFLPGAGISFGGHLGGLVFGALVSVALYEGDRRGPKWLGPALCGGLCVVAVVGSVLTVGQLGTTVGF